jgi:hypothetical protein
MSFLTPTLSKIQTAAVFFAGWLAVWLLELATLWILSVTSSNSVALTWSLWRIPDAVLFLVNLAVVGLYTGGNSYKPAIVVAIFTVGAVLSDVASLVTFTLQYISCVDDIESGDTLTDPLCMTADLKKVGGYHLGIISILLAGAILNLYVPIMMFRMRDRPIGGQSLKNVLLNLAGTLNNRRLQNLSLMSRFLTVVAGCAALLAVEVSILTDASDIKYLWFCHTLMLIPAIATVWPRFLIVDRINKIVAVVCVAALVGSGLGLSLMVWYFDWLCETTPPRTGFSNFETCEVGRTGAIYMVVIHATLTLISLVRLLVALYALRITASVQFSDAETSSMTADLPVYGELSRQSNTEYGTAYRRNRIVDDGTAITITSKLSGTSLIL